MLDAVKVSYPPDLAGQSLLPAPSGDGGRRAARLFGQNDRNLIGVWDARFKIVATPAERRYATRSTTASATRARRGTSRAREPDRMREERRELELFRERSDAPAGTDAAAARGPVRGEEHLSPEACERLKAMGYVQQGCAP